MQPVKIFEHSPEDRLRLQNRVCPIPFQDINIYEDGFVSLCCYTWQPTYIGNVNETSLYTMVQGQIVRDIQATMFDGSYKYCESKLCPDLANYISFGQSYNLLDKRADDFLSRMEGVKKTVSIFLNYDKSCNLECPSCRNEKILFTDKDRPASVQLTHDNAIKSIKELLEQNFQVQLNITGSGDAFASPLYSTLLKSLRDEDNVSLKLQTNGVLMTPDRFTPTMMRKTHYVNVSVDASTEETYRIVRKGGSFRAVQKNVADFDKLASAKSFWVHFGWQLNFVVQTENFLEIPDFARWVLSLKSRPVGWFNLIADWGHLGQKRFENKAIWREDHPRHREFLAVLCDDVLLEPQLKLGSLAPYVAKARNG